MGENLEKEGIVPSRAFDFLSHGGPCRMTANNVECKPSQDREVFRGIVFPGPIGVLGEDDVEYPVQAVLDAPMAAYDLQQSLGRHVFRKQDVPHERPVGRLPTGATT